MPLVFEDHLKCSSGFTWHLPLRKRSTYFVTRIANLVLLYGLRDFWSGITGIKVHRDSQWDRASRNLWQTSLQFFSHRVMKTHFSLKGIWKWDQQTLYFMTLGKMDWVSDIAYEHSNQLNIRRDFILRYLIWFSVYLNNVEREFSQETLYKKYKIQLLVAKDTISLAKNITQHKC